MKAVKEIQSRFVKPTIKENYQLEANRGPVDAQNECTEAEDLAVLLNSENKQDFNQSLFTIIDEMEEEDSKQSTPAREANQFFKTDLSVGNQIGTHLQKDMFSGTFSNQQVIAQEPFKPQHNFTVPKSTVPLLKLQTHEHKQALNHGTFEQFK